MGAWVEFLTTNGHKVLLDLPDWEGLRPLLAAGLRLQSIRTRSSVVVILREYHPPRTMLLAKALTHASDRDEVRHRNGDPLDHRRDNLERLETCRRPGWASLTHRAPQRG